VRHEYDQQRRTRCEAWCEERAGAAAGAGATRQARGVILPTGNSGKQRGDVKRAGASARTSEHDRASLCRQKPPRFSWIYIQFRFMLIKKIYPSFNTLRRNIKGIEYLSRIRCNVPFSYHRGILLRFIKMNLSSN